eukprot:1070801-Prorocentrum_minimum.AAC.2
MVSLTPPPLPFLPFLPSLPPQVGPPRRLLPLPVPHRDRRHLGGVPDGERDVRHLRGGGRGRVPRGALPGARGCHARGGRHPCALQARRPPRQGQGETPLGQGETCCPARGSAAGPAKRRPAMDLRRRRT